MYASLTEQNKKKCSTLGCSTSARQGGVCISHGAKYDKKRVRKICSTQECNNQAYSGGKCTSHGAKRKKCSTLGCSTSSRQGGVCYACMRKEDDELIRSLKEKKESDWTDKEKGRINKITKNRMIHRRRNRRRSFLDNKFVFNTLGSGQTTRLLLGISLEEWSEYLFKDFNERYPDVT